MAYCLIKNMLFENIDNKITCLNLSFGVYSTELDVNTRTQNIKYSSIDEITSRFNGRVIKKKIPKPVPVGPFLTRTDKIEINGFRIYVSEDMIINQYIVDPELVSQSIIYDKDSKSLLIQIVDPKMDVNEYLQLINDNIDEIYIEKISEDYKISNISSLNITNEQVIDLEIDNQYKWGRVPYVIDEDDNVKEFIDTIKTKYSIPVINHLDIEDFETKEYDELILYEVQNIYNKSQYFGKIMYDPIWGWLTLVQIPINIYYYSSSKSKYKERANDYYFHLFLNEITTFQTFDKKFPTATLWKDFLDSTPPTTIASDKKQNEGIYTYSFQVDVTLTCYLIKSPPKMPLVVKKIFREYYKNHSGEKILYKEFQSEQEKLESDSGFNGRRDDTVKD